MPSPEETLRTWLRSPDRVFVPSESERYAQGRSLGLSPREIQRILASEPELTRLKSGRVPKRQAAFRLRFWREGEIDLGFIHFNGTAHGIFFLGENERYIELKKPFIKTVLF